jgi:competence protein ComEC
MNSFVRWISQQERFVFQDVSFGLLQVFTAYLLIVTFLLLFKKQNFKRLTIAMIAVLIFQSVLIFDKNKNQTEAFIVFHKSRYSMMGIKKNATMTVLHNLDSSIYSRDNVTRNFKVGNALTAIKQDTLQSIYIFNNQKILVVDSSGVYKLPQFQPKYVVLRNSPKINLTRLLETIKPTLIIADGSNYKSYLERWEASCIKQNVPFHLTSREGAFVLKKD